LPVPVACTKTGSPFTPYRIRYPRASKLPCTSEAKFKVPSGFNTLDKGSFDVFIDDWFDKCDVDHACVCNVRSFFEFIIAMATVPMERVMKASSERIWREGFILTVVLGNLL
jgi:hypothetical protein